MFLIIIGIQFNKEELISISLTRLGLRKEADEWLSKWIRLIFFYLTLINSDWFQYSTLMFNYFHKKRSNYNDNLVFFKCFWYLFIFLVCLTVCYLAIKYPNIKLFKCSIQYFSFIISFSVWFLLKTLII